jgi:hypothetical protein
VSVEEAARCAHCGDVIGVYEPLVTLVEGRAHETSLAAEASCAERDVERFHRACYHQHSHARPFGE